MRGWSSREFVEPDFGTVHSFLFFNTPSTARQPCTKNATMEPNTVNSSQSDPKKEETVSSTLEYDNAQEMPQYLQGIKLHLLTMGYIRQSSDCPYYGVCWPYSRLLLGIFLVNFEISIVSTSLVSITDDLEGFGRSSWVITAYLLTYIGKLHSICTLQRY